MKGFNKVVFFLLSCFISGGIFAQNNTTHNDTFTDNTTPSTENLNDVVKTVNIPNCTEKLCIAKCCPEKQLLKYIKINQTSPPSTHKRKLIQRQKIVCADYDKEKSVFPEVPVFNKNFYETNKNVTEHFNLVGPDVMNITNFSKSAAADLRLYNVYIMEDSTLVLEIPNRMPSERWNYFNKSMYCIDYFISTKTGNIITKYYIIPKNVSRVYKDNYHLSAAMLVSSVFLLLVLVVYFLLPELRNLRGLVLMSYVASLLAGFTSFAVMNILHNFDKASTAVCKSFSFVIYFCILSSFFWMNVMSLDIWWTFRGFAKIRSIHRRGEMFKYMLYCSYAWGVPLLMTGALMVLNIRGIMRHLPWFVTPQIGNTGCFISDISRLLYLYVPMMLVLALNCVFFAMTVFNMWRLSRGHEVLTRAAVAAGTPSAHISNRNRFIVYLKLSAVMGVNWVLEVVSSLQPEWQIWIISDIYNLVTGMIIFFIFVWKKKIRKMLLKRYSRQQWTGRTHWLLRFGTIQERPASMTDSDASQETLSHTVSYNARGDGFD